MLNFIEVFAFSNAGVDVAASALGATSAWTAGAQFSTQANTYSNDLFCDPYQAAANSPQLMAGSAGAAALTVTFGATAQYPLGAPSPISQGTGRGPRASDTPPPRCTGPCTTRPRYNHHPNQHSPLQSCL